MIDHDTNCKIIAYNLHKDQLKMLMQFLGDERDHDLIKIIVDICCEYGIDPTEYINDYLIDDVMELYNERKFEDAYCW